MILNQLSSTQSTLETLDYIRTKIVSALTKYDKRQYKASLKNPNRYHNPHALPLYLQALDRWESDPKTISNPIDTLSNHFTTVQNDGITFCISDMTKVVRDLKAQYANLP